MSLFVLFMFVKEFNFHSGCEDIITEPIELRHGSVALLFARGKRRTQEDALWVGIKDGVLYMCASDGVGSIEGSELTAQKITEFGREAFMSQIQKGTIDPEAVQRQIDAKLYAWNPYHEGRATSLCMAIGDAIQASRIGDPVTWMDGQIYPHRDLIPEVDDFNPMREWWTADRNPSKEELAQQLALARIDRSGLLQGSLGYREFPAESNVDTDARTAHLSLPNRHFIAGSDGLDPYRFEDIFDAIHQAGDPRIFLLELLEGINTIGRDNASGLAFFHRTGELK